MINEWLANPLPGSDDWIELYNSSTTEPAGLQSVYLGTSNVVQQLTSLSFIPPGGYVQLHADEGVGPDHLDFKLPATPGAIILYDDAGAEIQRVRYGAQVLGVTQGRLPDGASNIVSFPVTPSPAAMNYTVAYTGPVLNEVMALNRSAVTNGAGLVNDWIELFNTNATSFDLSGMSLSLDEIQPGQWSFPFGTSIPANGYLVVWSDGSRAASLAATTELNTGRSLNSRSGGVYLFNTGGQLVDSIAYGFQLADMAIGRVGNQWRLLATATPGATNGVAATLGSPSAVRFNEWMANPWSGADWFEVYNTTNQPVNLGGLYLSDDPASASTNKFRIWPLSFVEKGGWVKWTADDNAAAGGDHVNFNLDAGGESLRLYSSTNALIDAIDFGYQTPGVSEGRLPDGAARIVAFPRSATPAEGNYQLLDGVVINEILAQSSAPWEDAIELSNLGPTAMDVSGWFLSDSRANPAKFNIPGGTVIPAGGLVVFYENQFNNGSPQGFSLDGSVGGEVWLWAADAGGLITGGATHGEFGPARDQISFGRHSTSMGVDYVALGQPTFGVSNPSSVVQFRSGTGGANAAPKVGPLVISELMYQPPAAAVPSVEYIEVQNISPQSISLGLAGSPAHTWQLRGAVEFSFPENITVPAGVRVLVVDFSPTAAPAAALAFRNRHAIPEGISLFGPFQGKLDNQGDDVRLHEPLSPPPGSGEAPYALVDRVRYESRAPWPAGGVNGEGLSLQRRELTLYGDDPENWVAASPTPGAANSPAIQALPTITLSPVDGSATVGGVAQLRVAASGPGPLSYQWRFNGLLLAGATDSTLMLDPVRLENRGAYDAFVSNAGGSVFSGSASFSVIAPLIILEAPFSQISRGGSNVTFRVSATGDAPLAYQWKFNGNVISGANAISLVVSNVGQAQSGEYTVTVSNPTSVRSATATLNVVFLPVLTLQPQPIEAIQGDTVSFTASAAGTLPMNFRWRRTTTTISNLLSLTGSSSLVLTNVKTSQAGTYTVLVTNLASSTGVTSAPVALTVLLDTDRDRLPDIWETANGFDPNLPDNTALDSDGDGLSDLQEYQSGTDPRDAGSFLRVEQIASSAGFATITFNALSNRTYSVLYKDRLDDLLWARLKSVFSRPTNRLETVVDPSATNAVRVYRLVTPLQP